MISTKRGASNHLQYVQFNMLTLEPVLQCYDRACDPLSKITRQRFLNQKTSRTKKLNSKNRLDEPLSRHCPTTHTRTQAVRVNGLHSDGVPHTAKWKIIIITRGL